MGIELFATAAPIPPIDPMMIPLVGGALIMLVIGVAFAKRAGKQRRAKLKEQEQKDKEELK